MNNTNHSISAIVALVNQHMTQSIMNEFSANQLVVQTQGVLGPMPDVGGQQAYSVKLTEGGESMLLGLPKRLVEQSKLTGGEYVQVSGTIKTKLDQGTQHRVEFSIDVSDIKTIDSPAVIKKRDLEKANLAKLQAMRISKNNFPFKERISISVILPNDAKIAEGFDYEVEQIQHSASVTKIFTDMTNKSEVIKAIDSAKGDILAMIRGGGDEIQFEMFNEMSMIKALSEFGGYRVLGFGHSNDKTLLEMMSEFSANTPAQAGEHIREAFEAYASSMNALKTSKDILEEEKTQLLYEKNQAAKEYAKQHEYWNHRISKMKKVFYGVILAMLVAALAYAWPDLLQLYTQFTK